MKNEGFEGKSREENSQGRLHFENVDITPERDFQFDLHVRKEPIDIRDGDALGSNYVEVRFRDETSVLMNEAEKLQELPEEERLTALMELVRAKLKYPYPEVLESARQEHPNLEGWLGKRFGERPTTADLELNEFLRNGYGDCKIMAAAYLVAAQAAKLKGIYANSGTRLKNMPRPDTGKPVFKSVEVDRDLNSAHAWVEIQLSDGRWIPVDPTTNMIGSGEMLEVFKRVGYKVPVAYTDSVPQELELDRGESYFEPGESEKDIRLRLKIGKEVVFGKSSTTQKLKTDKYSGGIDIVLASAEDPKSINLEFSTPIGRSGRTPAPMRR